MTASASNNPAFVTTELTSGQDRLIEAAYFNTQQSLPLVIRPAHSGISLADLDSWAEASRRQIGNELTIHGTILFRGFPVTSVDDFESFAISVSGSLLDYSERSSPRSELKRTVYTSTDHPPSQRIFPHNEHSYSLVYPQKLFFCCLVPASKGGETPLADIRKVTRRISPGTQERFRQKQWMYVRNFGDGLGLPWQTAFQTADPSVVEATCREKRIEFEWKPGGRLRTRQVRPAFVTHSVTGESLWFNHITFFHLSTLDSVLREVLATEFSEEDLPNNTYYGDGTRIEAEVMHELRNAYESELVSFAWQTGDVVLLDNVLTAHARASFSGPRKVLFAMADPIVRTDF